MVSQSMLIEQEQTQLPSVDDIGDAFDRVRGTTMGHVAKEEPALCCELVWSMS